MTQRQATAQRVAAQESCAKSRTGEAPCPTDTTGFAPIQRWDLLEMVTELRRTLRLTTNDVAVFRALLSFLPVRGTDGRDCPVTPGTLTIVFASNSEITRRANGLDERVLRHAFRRLADAGLLARRDSATGKRFPIRRQGRIVDAYGLDLSPALKAAPTLRDTLRVTRDTAEECRALRTELLARRKQLATRFQTLSDHALAWLQDLGRILRRKLSPQALLGLLQDMDDLETEPERAATPAVTSGNATEEAPAPDTPQAERKRVTDGRIYRHIESEKIDLDLPAQQSGRAQISRCWQHCSETSRYFPDAPRTLTELKEVIFLFSKMMTLKTETVVHASARLGWIGTLFALEYLATKAMSIRNPSAYLHKMLADHEAGRAVGWLPKDLQNA